QGTGEVVLTVFRCRTCRCLSDQPPSSGGIVSDRAVLTRRLLLLSQVLLHRRDLSRCFRHVVPVDHRYQEMEHRGGSIKGRVVWGGVAVVGLALIYIFQYT